ncbi:hypothetical protein F4778DRAFT_142284 [Xylariomycetidae sp. FL2044]|nr:hypothetical protein F4778DRAFT_142284 [Xylariomycetidae sp. FL2044]
MKPGSLSLLIWLLLAAACRASLLEYADQLPECGLTCLLHTIPSSPCQTLTNDTCICTNEELYTATAACTALKCTVTERLAILNLEKKACGIPARTRRSDIPGQIVVQIFSLACIAMRIYARYTSLSKLETDDYMVLLMAVTYLAFLGLGNFVRISAIGYDLWTLDEPTITNALKFFFITETLYTAVPALCRMGVLFFLMRVFTIRRFQSICWIVMAWVVVSAVTIILLTIFQCHPIEYNWLGWKGDYGAHQCINVNVLSFAAAGSSILQDFVILLLPLPVITQLKMPLKRKLLTLFMFSLGVLVTAISCLRLQYLIKFAKSQNPTWDYTEVVIWTSAEVEVSVIVLCLPSLRTLLARLYPRVFGSESPSRAPQTPEHLQAIVHGADLERRVVRLRQEARVDRTTRPCTRDGTRGTRESNPATAATATATATSTKGACLPGKLYLKTKAW